LQLVLSGVAILLKSCDEKLRVGADLKQATAVIRRARHEESSGLGRALGDSHRGVTQAYLRG
jgi:hypothetical protein